METRLKWQLASLKFVFSFHRPARGLKLADPREGTAQIAATAFHFIPPQGD